MQVKALRKGFDNIKIREEGEQFNWPGKDCPKWCEEVGKKAAPAKGKGNAPAQDIEVE